MDMEKAREYQKVYNKVQNRWLSTFYTCGDQEDTQKRIIYYINQTHNTIDKRMGCYNLVDHCLLLGLSFEDIWKNIDDLFSLFNSFGDAEIVTALMLKNCK